MFFSPRVCLRVAFAVLLWSTFPASADEALGVVRDRVVELTNQVRRQAGLPPVLRVDYLEAAAQGHSLEMAEQGYFSHYSSTPGRRDASARIAAQGGWDTSTGENIYRGSGSAAEEVAQQAVESWLRSPAHHKILMNPNFNSIGVGVCRRGDDYYITQDFSKQTIEVLHASSSQTDKGYDVVLQGRIREGSLDGALFADNVLRGQFQAGSDGVFELRAVVPAQSKIAVSLRSGPTRFSTKLAFPVEALSPR